MKESDELYEDHEWDQVWDDITDKEWDHNFVRQARREEIDYFENIGVHTKVPIDECI